MQHGHGNKANRANTLQVKTFKDLEFDALDMGPMGQAKHAKMQFDNGYSISVIAGRGHYSTPRENGLDSSKYTSFEVAILYPVAEGKWATKEFFPDHDDDALGS